MDRLVNIGKFHFLVNKVLPTVYDDSLSYYEVLCKVVDKINEIIETDNKQNEILNNIPQDVSQFAEQLAEYQAETDAKILLYKQQIDDALDAFETEIRNAITTDTTPTQGSTNLITSGGVYASLQDIYNRLVTDTAPTQGSSDLVTSGGVYTAIQNAKTELNTAIAAKEDKLTFDTAPTNNSSNPVYSGGVYSAINNAVNAATQYTDTETGADRQRLTSLESAIETLNTNKQNKLTFDEAPTAGSANPVTSRGIYNAIQGAVPAIELDPVPVEGSTKFVNSGGIYTALNTLADTLENELDGKQDALTFDLAPVANSTNPVYSGGVWSAIQNIQPSVTIDGTPTKDSTNAVSSGGVWSACNDLQTQIDTAEGEITALNTAMGGKQNVLTFDAEPTEDSVNPVTSGGVWTALNGKEDTLTFDTEPTEDSANPVTSGGVWTAINNIPVDQSISDAVATSENPVSTKAVYDYIFDGTGAGTDGHRPIALSLWSENSVLYNKVNGGDDLDDTSSYATYTLPTKSIPTIAQIKATLISPEQHANIFRGKNLGTEVTAAQLEAIRDGSFTDLYVGDYWVINSINWRIADIDYWYGKGDTAFNSHHLAIVPETVLATSVKMESTATTANGYAGSEMFTTNLVDYRTAIAGYFPDIVLSHREIFSKAASSGVITSTDWYDSTVDLMNENMVYGHHECAAMSTGSGAPRNWTIDLNQLALFRIAPKFIKTSTGYFLRDISDASTFCFVNNNGESTIANANLSRGVRPVFAIG